MRREKSEGVLEPRICKCGCGHSFQMNEKDGPILRCPSCGRITAFPGKGMVPGGGEEFMRFVEAAFEVLGEDDEDLCPFSGAR